MSLFDELKRRNVFRVGIAYAVGAWVLLQLTDVVGEILELPPWGGKLILLMIVVGFPITLFVAWAFELTPEGIKREHEVDRSQSIAPQTGKKLNNTILVLMAIAIAYLLIDKFRPADTGVRPVATAIQTDQPAGSHGDATATANDQASKEPAPVTDGISPQSIAVLPFDNRSRLEDDEFFVEGVHDDLLTNLARIGDLKVISRTSVLRYKDTELPIPDIAKELRVATVMEGAVQRSGNTVRINVQLIDATTDEHLWAEIFDREMTADNLFAIQTEISEKIAAALKTTLSPEEEQRISESPTANLAAYNAYLRGRQLMTRRNSEDMEQAMVEFNRAVEVDPDFALAWVGVAEAAGLLTNYSNMSVPESLRLQTEATNKALSINDKLGEAHLAQAVLYYTMNEWGDAERAYQKALELSPGYATAYQWYGAFLREYPHRLKEAVAIQSKARDLDPMSSIIRLDIGQTLMALGDFDAAEAQIEEALALDPDFAPAYNFMSRLMQSIGRFDQQIYWINKSKAMDPGRINLFTPLAFAYLDLDDPEAFESIRSKIEAIDDQSWVLGMVDSWGNLYQRNYAAAMESGQWVNNKLGNVPDFQEFFGWVHTIAGEFENALTAFEAWEPRFKDPATWRAAIEQTENQGCLFGWLMMQTGKEATGRDLVKQTLAYLENELPRYIEHADRYGYEMCYLALGDLDKALDFYETAYEHGHLSGWWLFDQIPLAEPIRSHPRYQATLTATREKLAAQRQALRQQEAEASL